MRMLPLVRLGARTSGSFLWRGSLLVSAALWVARGMMSTSRCEQLSALALECVGGDGLIALDQHGGDLAVGIKKSLLRFEAARVENKSGLQPTSVRQLCARAPAAPLPGIAVKLTSASKPGDRLGDDKLRAGDFQAHDVFARCFIRSTGFLGDLFSDEVVRGIQGPPEQQTNRLQLLAVRRPYLARPPVMDHLC